MMSNGKKLSVAIKKLLSSDRELRDLSRSELLAIVEDDACPQFLADSVAAEFKLRLENRAQSN